MILALVLEDERSISNLVRSVLERQGYTVLQAASGEQAIRLAERNIGKITLLVADVLLRNQQGPEIARRLRRTQPFLACLFVSGRPMDQIEHSGLLDPANTAFPRVGFLQKPFTPRTLIEAVSALLAGRTG